MDPITNNDWIGLSPREYEAMRHVIEATGAYLAQAAVNNSLLSLQDALVFLETAYQSWEQHFGREPEDGA